MKILDRRLKIKYIAIFFLVLIFSFMIFFENLWPMLIVSVITLLIGLKYHPRNTFNLFLILIFFFSFIAGIAIGKFNLEPRLYIPALDFPIVSFIFIIICVFLLANLAMDKKRVIKLSKLDKVLLLFLFLVVVSITLIDNAKGYQLFLTGSYILMFSIILYFFIKVYVNSKEKLIITIKTWFFSGFALALLAILEFFVWRFYLGQGGYRVVFFTTESNYLALSLITFIPVGIYLIREKTLGKESWLVALATVLIFVAMILTSVRSVLFALPIILIYLFYLFTKGKSFIKKSIFLILIFIIIILGLFVMPAYVLEKYLTISNELDKIIHGKLDPALGSERVGLLMAGYYMFKDNPLGIGLSNYPVHFQEKYGPLVGEKYDYEEWKYNAPINTTHNLVLEALAPFGILSLFVVLVIIYFSLKKYYKAFKKNKDIGMLASFIVLLICAQFLGILLHSIFWFFIALSDKIKLYS